VLGLVALKLAVYRPAPLSVILEKPLLSRIAIVPVPLKLIQFSAPAPVAATKSEAVAVTYTTAEPVSVIAAPAFELSVTERVSVVPEAV
jgi:hypothetical protein